MLRVLRLVSHFVASLALLSALVATAADETLSRAKNYLDQGDAQAAYSLLLPLQGERAGDPDFDYLLGAAALELGKNTEAVFALERVLAVKPDATPARALIARAYFNLKENETAKREFENVRKQDVPPEVALTIDRFLDAIARAEESQRVSIHGYVEMGGGYDSNVNSATSANSVAVPAFGGAIFTLASSSQEQSDGFLSLVAGVGASVPLTRQLTLFGGVSYQNKSNFNEDNFDTYAYDVNAGVAYKFSRDVVSVAWQSNKFFVDDPVYKYAYREANGAIAQWQHDFNARNQVSAFAQFAQLDYPDQDIRNAKRYVGGLGFAHAYGRRASLVAYVGVYGGKEKEDDDLYPQFGHDLYGVRLGAQQFISEKYSVFLNGSAEKRKYGGPDPFFGVDREDEQYTASAGLHFTPAKNIRLTPQASWTDNQSNLSINEFKRWVVSVILRRDF